MKSRSDTYPYAAFFPHIDRSEEAKLKHIASVRDGLIPKSVPVIYRHCGEYEVCTAEEYRKYYGKDFEES